MNTTSILIADDHEMVRKGLRATLEAESGWTVVGEAANGREAIDLATTLRPNVVVMDIGMPELNGLEATREIHRRLPDTRVLVLTVYEAEHVVNEVLAAGAQGYLLKSDAGRELVQAVRDVEQKKAHFTPRIAGMIMVGTKQDRNGSPELFGPASTLSRREREILQLLAEGQDTREIAARLRISIRTVGLHRHHIMIKVGTRTVAGLVRYAIRNHIIQA